MTLPYTGIFEKCTMMNKFWQTIKTKIMSVTKLVWNVLSEQNKREDILNLALDSQWRFRIHIEVAIWDPVTSPITITGTAYSTCGTLHLSQCFGSGFNKASGSG